ncbi:hypothetical protein [uncultured Dokdonia sp.]|uniref:hypothetical protein n=1 Tax=uncultured Dokdonia sp. TaxID=575653 RepID=UPI002618367F|nr:hypothetical protein [uncultured Dokdonia sp.]
MKDALTYKISCPSCGASSGFSEKRPGSYTCGYCGTAFEHQSIIPSKNQEKVLYDYFVVLQQDYKNVSQENPDRDTIVYGLLMQMNGIVEGLVSSVSFEEVLQKYVDYTSKEIDHLESIGLREITTLDIVLEKDIMLEAKLLADYKLSLSQTFFKFKKEEKSLTKALQYVSSAEAIYLIIFTTFDHNITGLKLDILKYLGLEKELNSALQNALHSEDNAFVERIRFRFKEFIH